MRVHLVVLRQTVDFGRGEVDEEMVCELDAMLICWCGKSLALKVATANKATIDVGVGESDGTGSFKIKIDKMASNCAEIWAFNYLAFHYINIIREVIKAARSKH